ncbi:DNA-binding MarR family transcriptional regulator [Chitinivorax tropicus]|uniref:DNA-binding MarR family transcriptional regulator n=1 Tax=Chitinivorax tropicus TaxID=714531 RepID=A0A840MNB6_9PROT|nr:hypothetical protein [Chitinivorax tropicus]MBB5017673.1 DNA-binding MarR family transcriptional regulator [Chitinivorax tropicus]
MVTTYRIQLNPASQLASHWPTCWCAWLIALVLCGPVMADESHQGKPPAGARSADESAPMEHRERRLERALRDGKLTAEEAERIREGWRGQGAMPNWWGGGARSGVPQPDDAWSERRKKLNEILTPVQKQQFEEMQAQWRQARERLEQGFTESQRELSRRRHALSPEARRQLYESFTPEQREQIKSFFKQQKQAREHFFNSLSPEQRAQLPPPPMPHPPMTPDGPPGGD